MTSLVMDLGLGSHRPWYVTCVGGGGRGAKRRPLLRIVRVTDPKTATPLLRALSGVMSSFAPKLGVIKLQSNAISRDPLVVRSYVSLLGCLDCHHSEGPGDVVSFPFCFIVSLLWYRVPPRSMSSSLPLLPLPSPPLRSLACTWCD
jgi:hypothetical protein